MKRRVTIPQHKVPYLHEKIIEEHAQLLLDEWTEHYSPVTSPPVPIDDILELHLGLTLVIEDLRKELGHPDILGGIWFGDRVIKVDCSLDPNLVPQMLGRYRFTLAHEVGHWRLHRQHLLKDPSAKSLFEADCEPAFVNRSGASPPEEIQANAFAACVLMPCKLIHQAWLAWRGTDEPVALSSLCVGDHHADRASNEARAMDHFCKPLAKRFEVSAEAMRYRLVARGLLVREKVPTLFT